jgi:hypothetical protein
MTTGGRRAERGLVPSEELQHIERLEQSVGEAAEPQAMRLHVVPIESKLGLEPSDPPSGPRSPEPVPGKRARRRAYTF